MINIFRRLVAALSPGLGSPLSPGLSAMLNKHKKHHHLALATLALIIAGTGAYTFRHEIAQAATYTWTQASWAGGVSATTATHTSNQTGWTNFSATSSTSVLASAGGGEFANSSAFFY